MQTRFFRTVCTSLKVFVCGALVVGVVGCSNDSVLAPSSATPSSPTPSVDLTGTWSGNFLQEGSEPIPVTWVANQTGAAVSGALVVSIADMGDIHATLRGVISGTDQITWTLAFEAGSIEAAPACSAIGSGSSAPSATAISMNLDITYASECIGVVAEQPTETLKLSLSRQ